MRLLFALMLYLLATVLTISPATAHKEHEQNQVAEVPAAGLPATTLAAPPAAQAREEEEPPTAFARLLDWLGRLHPSIVHFPLAFFPAALFTAVVGRKRPAFGEPVRFLVVAGGLTAPLAMLLGWLDGGWTLLDTDQVLAVHRWLGTVIGLAGLGLAAWTLARPASVRGTKMLAALSVMTVAILVQGWHGGALIHGIDHLNW